MVGALVFVHSALALVTNLDSLPDPVDNVIFCVDVNTENHVINWDEATVIARESDRTTRWIREAVKIRQESHGCYEQR